MKNQKKKLSCKLLAAVLCFAMMISAIAPITARSAASQAMTLKYKGKTLTIPDGEGGSLQFPLYDEIQKAFGKADKISEEETMYTEETATKYKYKADGFNFTIIQNESSTQSYVGPATIKITSTKAVLNGIKVGMPYNKVLKKLEKNYGKDNITTQKNKKKITQNLGMITEYTFKNGKISKMYFYYH